MTAPISTIEVGGQRARILDSGAGDHTVVVLHGWGGRIESMTPIIDCLKERFRVIAIDLPGFGESPVPTGVWGTPDYATWVHDLIVSLDVGQVHLVGHSFGGKVCFYLATIYPQVVERLVLTGSAGLRMPASNKARVRRAVSRTARAAGKLGPPGRSVREAIYRRIASEDYRDAGSMRPIFVKVVNEDFETLLPRVGAPTLLIWGTNDDSTPLTHGSRMSELIPDAGLVTFEGAGHFAYLEEPVRFCRVVRHFFGAPVDG